MEGDFGQIRNFAQARTAEQYLEVLNREMMDDNISLVDYQFKQYESQIILDELKDFNQNRSIRLVVVNEEEDLA